MARNPAIPLALGGLASVLIISGIQGESLAEVLKGEFGKGKGKALPDPTFGTDLEAQQAQTTPGGPTAEPYGANQPGYISPIPKGVPVKWQRNDKGVDFGVPPGTPFRAVNDGTIEILHDPAGFGQNYAVLHTTSGSSYYYGHAVPSTANGARVKKGEIVAYANTKGQGNATEPGHTEFGPYPFKGSPEGGETIRNWLLGLPRL